MSPTYMSEKERQDRIDSLLKQREALLRNINWLEEMKSQYGINVPLDILSQLQEVRERLKKVEQELEELQGAEEPLAPAAPSNAIIRQLLNEAFSDEDFAAFCFDNFPDVYDKFSTGMTKTQKILLLVEHSQHTNKIDELLKLVQKANPAKYAEYADKLYPAKTPAADSGEKAGGVATGASRERTFSGIRNRWALLVGINDYEDQAISDLKVCVSDVVAVHKLIAADSRSGGAKAMVRLLIDQGGDTLPTRNEILTGLAALTQAADPEDMVLFYFSGHGDVVDGEAYLLPRDARHAALAMTSVALRDVQRILAQSPAHAKVMILDACHSGATIGKAGVKMSADFIRRAFEEAEGTAVLSSCKQDQVSWEDEETGRSVFTRYLLEALGGGADFDQKGFVTVADASRYVTDKVKLWAAGHSRVQTPTLQYTTAGDIILLDRRPR
jgi:hypothetical protein